MRSSVTQGTELRSGVSALTRNMVHVTADNGLIYIIVLNLERRVDYVIRVDVLRLFI